MTDTTPAAFGADERRQIEAACARLSLDYCHFADLGQMETWSQLFAEAAELVVRGVAQIGRPAILKSVSGPRGELQTVHAISNLRIDVVSPTKAEGLVYITAYMVPKTDGVATMRLIAPSAVGRYEDVYRKTSDGWRFARREFIQLIAGAA